MRNQVFSIFLMLLVASGCNNIQEQSKIAYVSDPSEEDWIMLFNGKDLHGWIPKIRTHELEDNFNKTFTVEDGYMTVQYNDYGPYEDRFGHIFYQDSFSYYRISLDYRFIGDQVEAGPGWAYRNSGIMIHCQNPASMGRDQDFPISIEAQLLGGNGTDARATMNLCTPGTHVHMSDTLFTPHCINSTSETYHGDQWVTAEALVLGDSLIIHYVNGQEVLRYSKPQVGGGSVTGLKDGVWQEGKALRGGWISLQSESHPIQFKQVQLLDLCGCKDPQAKNYKSYLVKHDPDQCIFE